MFFTIRAPAIKSSLNVDIGPFSLECILIMYYEPREASWECLFLQYGKSEDGGKRNVTVDTVRETITIIKFVTVAEAPETGEMTETADEVQHERIPRRRKRRFESKFFLL